MDEGNDEASMLIISAEEGSGKTSLLAQSTKEISDLCLGSELSFVVSIQSFDEGCVLQRFR
jgi:hypothetical protein